MNGVEMGMRGREGCGGGSNWLKQKSGREKEAEEEAEQRENEGEGVLTEAGTAEPVWANWPVRFTGPVWYFYFYFFFVFLWPVFFLEFGPILQPPTFLLFFSLFPPFKPFFRIYSKSAK